MKPRFLAIILLLICTPLAAQTNGPAIYDVVGVASNDVLQIRALASAESESLGSLRHDAQGVEVTGQSADGKWALINHGEATGWVALRYLRQRAAWADGTPFGLACYGTEPFWSARLVPGFVEYSDMSGAEIRYRETDRLRGAGAGFADLAVLGAAAGQEMSMIISPAACGDGMSDRSFALQVQLLRPGSAMPLLSGCCSMTAGQ